MTASLIADNRDGMGARLSRTVYRPTESLEVNPKNVKKRTKKQIGQIVQSMTTNIVPILVGPDRHVLRGTVSCWSPMRTAPHQAASSSIRCSAAARR